MPIEERIYAIHTEKLRSDNILFVTVGDGKYMYVELSDHLHCATIHRFKTLAELLTDYDGARHGLRNVVIHCHYLSLAGRLTAQETEWFGRDPRACRVYFPQVKDTG